MGHKRQYTDSMFLYGKNSVFERVKTEPSSIRRVYLQDNFDSPQIVNALRSANIPFKRVSDRELTRIKKADRLQGIVAEVDRYQYASFEELLYSDGYAGISFIFLDRINDPHNLGSIMRTAACFGGFAVVIPQFDACDVNETVLHVASGAENYVPVSAYTNLSKALKEAKERGFWSVGAVVEGGEDINNVSLPFPLCLVLGCEGKGIRLGLEKQLDLKVTLPMKGAALSFNVAMASAILCYEITRQKNSPPQK